ncbi:MAG: hypothetical protein ACD_21C00246G0003 [uncultured bacterium]|nr:MAG: hypothetical protein ACD_21C00246G0003 [uncultured bacterium]
MVNREHVCLSLDLLDRFVSAVKAKFPKKAFGYFLAPMGSECPSEFVVFDNDIRNDWKDTFEQYGSYYKIHEDAGFLATPEETYKVEKYIRNNKLHKVGVFHSHKRHPAIFASIDVTLHPDESLWHLIISLRNLDFPQIKAFALDNSSVKELKILSN